MPPARMGSRPSPSAPPESPRNGPWAAAIAPRPTSTLPAVAFDEDAADGFRPPPHPDDRLWRHPSELKNVGDAGARRDLPSGDGLPALTPARTPDWLGIAGHMALVGGVGVVAIALALAVLGIPQRVRDRSQETTLSTASVTTAAPPSSAPSLWSDTDPTPDTGNADPEPQTDPADEVIASGSDVPDEEPPVTPTPAEPERSETGPAPAWLGVDGRAMPTIDLDLDADADGGGPAEGSRSYDDLASLHPADLDGVLVTNVVADSPAASHVWPGDVIVSVDGHPTSDMDTLLGVLADLAPGDEVEVVHRRLWHRTPLTSTITLTARP